MNMLKVSGSHNTKYVKIRSYTNNIIFIAGDIEKRGGNISTLHLKLPKKVKLIFCEEWNL